MFIPPLKYRLCGALSALALCFGTVAHAAYPERPVSLVVNFSAGGPLDLVARLIAAKASKVLNQSVIVENKPGASGTIGAEYVARSKADGYMLLLSVDTLATVNPFVYKNNPFNADKDLSIIGRAGAFNQVLVTRAGLGPTTLKQFITLAAQQHLSYASGGAASPGHLTMESFMLGSHLKMTHIPYKGNAPAVNALLGGQVDSGFLAIAGVIQHIKAHKLTPLAVSGKERDPLLPTIPTIAESGIPGLENFDTGFGFVLMTPKKTPKAIVLQWNTLLNKILKEPDILEKLKTLNIQPTYGTPAEAEQILQRAAQSWKTVVEKTHISLD